jgi:hypothetical protein
MLGLCLRANNGNSEKSDLPLPVVGERTNEQLLQDIIQNGVRAENEEEANELLSSIILN